MRFLWMVLFLCDVSVSAVMIRQFPTNVTALLGGEASFKCRVAQQLGSEYVFWKKVGIRGFTTVLSYNNVSLNVNKYSVRDAYVLTVHDVQLSDEAEYECQAGKDRARASLTVRVMMENMTLSWGSAPPFHPKSLVNLTCHVTHSRPPAEIRWFHGGEELTSLATSCHSTFDNDGFGDVQSILKLTLTEEAVRDAYTCKASLPGVSVSRSEVLYPSIIGASTSFSPPLPQRSYLMLLAIAVAVISSTTGHTACVSLIC